jgi:DNA repair protein RadD
VELRPYQEQAVEAIFAALDRGEHPVVSIATGGGKSLVAAAVAARIPGRVLVVTHRQELLQQNGEKIAAMSPDESFGYYSSGLGRRDISQRIILGGVQSIGKRMGELQSHGTFESIIIDECHRVPPKAKASLYHAVFSACPQALRIGLSATPYRLDDGPVYGEEETWFTSLAFHLGIGDLTPEYLKPLHGVLMAHGIDTKAIRQRMGEFVESDLSQVACEEELVQGACREMVRLGNESGRKSWIVFCVDVAHTNLVTAELCRLGVDASALVGDTPKDERASLLQRLREGKLRALVNCEVATTGFDVPRIDLVAMLRPTMSKSLVLQMAGRGCRLTDHAQDCLILDYAGNIERHKPLDGLAKKGRSKERIAMDEEELELLRAAERERQIKHLAEASLTDPFSDGVASTRYEVFRMTYKVEPSKNPKYRGKSLVRVGYFCPQKPGNQWVNAWVCPEYEGYAREKAMSWCRLHGLHPEKLQLDTARKVAAHGRSEDFIMPETISVKKNGSFEVIDVEYMPVGQRNIWEDS